MGLLDGQPGSPARKTSTKTGAQPLLTGEAAGASAEAPNPFAPVPSDQLASVQAQVDEVRSVMQQNVRQMLDNVDKAEGLENTSSQLATQARAFNSSARGVRRHLWWQGLKFKLGVGFTLILLLFLIL